MRTDVERGAAPDGAHLTVREFISWFGYLQRGEYMLNRIRDCLDENGLEISGDYEVGWLDGPITISLADENGVDAAIQAAQDPTIRVTVIKEAHEKPESVKPDAELRTKYLPGLALAQGWLSCPSCPNDWKVEGIITWQSIARNLSRRQDDAIANQLFDTTIRIVPEIPVNAPLYSVMSPIQEHGFVLVRGEDNSITGLVTARSFARQYARLARPYMMIGEIERSLRALIRGKFSSSVLKAATLGQEDNDHIGPEDLTLGDYVSLLGNKDNWENLGLRFVDRKEFARQLEWLRERRNEIMHFHPDGIDPEYVEGIERLLKYIRNLM